MRVSAFPLLLFLFLTVFSTASRVEAQGEKARAATSVFISETEPVYVTSGKSKVARPPGPEMQAPPPDTEALELWRFRGGKMLKLKFIQWDWETLPSKDGPRRWQVQVTWLEQQATDLRTIPAAALDPVEEQRLLKYLWGQHLQAVKERGAEQNARDAEAKDAGNWTERIAAYTGNEPRKPGERGLPSLKSPDMEQAPDLRTLQIWRLNNRQGIERKVGKVQILDWGVDKVSYAFLIGAYGIPVKVRLGDGTEEVVFSGMLRTPNGNFVPVLMSLWKDWAKLRASGKEIEGAEFKIKALEATLPEYWSTTRSEREREVRDSAQIAAKDAAELRKPYRFGRAIPFPGAAPAGFKDIEAAAPDRSTIPVLDQGPLGARASDCLPSAIATFFLWWDEQKWLPLNQKGDLLKRADWLHTQFAREMRTLNNGGTDWSNVLKGLTDFSKRFLESRYAFQVSHDSDYSAANIARYILGGHATVLTLTLWNSQRESGRHAVAVLSATADGEMTVATWGMKLSGKWKPVDLPKAAKKSRQGDNPQPTLEFEFSNLTEENKKKLRGTRFILDGSNWDGLSVITPFVATGAAAADAPKKQ